MSARLPQLEDVREDYEDVAQITHEEFQRQELQWDVQFEDRHHALCECERCEGE